MLGFSSAMSSSPDRLSQDMPTKKLMSLRPDLKVQYPRTWHCVVCCLLFSGSKAYNRRSHMARLRRRPFCGFPLHLLGPRGYFLPLVFHERWDDCRPPGKGWDAFALGGGKQLESSGGLNLAKVPGEVTQLFGDDLSLCGRTHLVSTAVPFLR